MRLARLVVRHARLRDAAAQRRIAIVLAEFPTKHARVGIAVGLDTPASAIVLLDALRAAGYDVARHPRRRRRAHARADRRRRPRPRVPHRRAAGRRAAADPGADYLALVRDAAAALSDAMVARLGPAARRPLPGRATDFVVAGLELGNVVLPIQPPRGYGENPVGDLPRPRARARPPLPRRLPLARPRVCGADAIVHLGKHGTLEWLPGKMLGLSAACAPDAALGDVPLVYPFVVNDPGEGMQAKRRAHAVWSTTSCRR